MADGYAVTPAECRACLPTCCVCCDQLHLELAGIAAERDEIMGRALAEIDRLRATSERQRAELLRQTELIDAQEARIRVQVEKLAEWQAWWARVGDR